MEAVPYKWPLRPCGGDIRSERVPGEETGTINGRDTGTNSGE
ncbi:MAG: hypothetical protein PHW11_02085 [Anaerolineaceae bacterium]|nr:hypothetical protein [Anaerolineaceae bacterium]MDD4043044.1 hypothetical protein [Anaerolineaceae bacterium]MDD4577278.1 hypothetical protein [Anaerolineaceae bacterium]